MTKGTKKLTAADGATKPAAKKSLLGQALELFENAKRNAKGNEDREGVHIDPKSFLDDAISDVKAAIRKP